MEIVKAWLINREGNGNEILECYDSRDEAVMEARALDRKDREGIVGIYEALAILTPDGILEPMWSDEFPECNSRNGLIGGEEVDSEELRDIIENGRHMD